MKKIPTLFRRDPDDRAHVLPEVTPGCEWVLTGEGVATRKYDGTCVMLDEDGSWWARREVRPGKVTPLTYRPISTDEVTGKIIGWEPIADSPFAKFHAEALAADPLVASFVGTYELVGPKDNGNPERTDGHILLLHGSADRFDFATPGEDDVPTGPDQLFDYMAAYMGSLREDGIEGIVWHHPDGRMAKLKARDFR